MRNRVMSILLVVTSRIIAAGALTTFQAVAVLAAGDCATKPNVRTPPGGHWYYHVDAVSNRKCWFLRQEEEGSPAPSSQAQGSWSRCPADAGEVRSLLFEGAEDPGKDPERTFAAFGSRWRSFRTIKCPAFRETDFGSAQHRPRSGE